MPHQLFNFFNIAVLIGTMKQKIIKIIFNFYLFKIIKLYEKVVFPT